MPLADPDDLARAGRLLLDRGIYVTLAFYPGVPREEVGELLEALDGLADAVPLRPAGA